MGITKTKLTDIWSATIHILADKVTLEGELILPQDARGVVLFAHGSGSSRHSPRNQFVAQMLRTSGMGTLLLDLLTPQEESVDFHTRHLRFDIDLLAKRLMHASRWLEESTEWINKQAHPEHLRLGYFGASTGGGAALMAAAALGTRVGAIVSRGGRPDLAGPALAEVKAPTLLIVGGFDEQVIDLNKDAYAQMTCEKALQIVPGATHLFEEPGTLDKVAELAADWFQRHLQP
ncbi:MAG: dienelactone hydrolase family protein [Methylobacter sp.]|nr:dienelactone hydrolase family protein [Methylobacter sp.]